MKKIFAGLSNICYKLSRKSSTSLAGLAHLAILGELAVLATLDGLVNLKRSRFPQRGRSGTLRYCLKRSSFMIQQPQRPAICGIETVRTNAVMRSKTKDSPVRRDLRREQEGRTATVFAIRRCSNQRSYRLKDLERVISWRCICVYQELRQPL